MSKVEIPSDGSSAVAITDKHGVTRYFNEFGQLHREGDLPAEINPNHETVLYYKNGLLHRDNGPALINSHQECYYQHGAKHREGDLPALIHFIKHDSGSKEILSQEYFQNNVHHREHGPALMWSSGSYQHYRNGLLHNENGPACHYVENGKTTDEYWLNGVQVPKFAHKLVSMKESILGKPKF